MTQTHVGLLLATSLAVGMWALPQARCARRAGRRREALVGALALLLLVAQLEFLGALRDALADAAAWVMLSLTISCLIDVLSVRLLPAPRLAL